MGMFLHAWSALHEHECEDGHDHPDMSYAMGLNAIGTSLASYSSRKTLCLWLFIKGIYTT